MPLVVAARMSLSFPILFCAVPLYRRDFPHDKGGETTTVQRMLFSDGGLSSNFPVHFFDALLPNRPTFAVSLEEFDQRDPSKRVRLPMKAGGGIWLDCSRIESLTGFLMSLVSAAKDWQDRLQSTLPGYRERIASVYLKSDEGGLNLTMAADKIANLVDLGDRAAALMTGTPLSFEDKQAFDFEDHRWRRYLVAFARLEETIEQAANVWYMPPNPARTFIEEYMKDPASYDTSSLEWRQAVFERFDSLMAITKGWNGTPLRDTDPGYIPKPRTTMRITPVS
jgi:predicted acylesterase/phospholipase RssA